MKTSKFFLGALAALSLGTLASCSSDEPVNNGNGVAQKNETRYLKVTISNPSTTSRVDNDANNFSQATAAESEVNTLYFKFFDADGKPVATKTEEIANDEFVDAGAGLAPSVDKIATKVVSIDFKEGDKYPAYVLCFINPTNWADIADETLTLNDFRDRKRASFRNGDYFSMNNSVYYGADAVSGAANVKISATPITQDKLFTSIEAANEATAEAAVDIYVERYAAKVQFSIAEGAVKDVTVGAYTLTYIPDAWSVNADANEMYAIKRYENSDADSDVIPSFDDVQTMLGEWTTWNDEPLHRSYWACSPSFYATAFPQVSDNIIDQVATGTGAGQIVGDYKLKYYSYNQIMGTTGTGAGVKSFAAAADGTLPRKYVMENTVGEQAFVSANPKAAVPSLLLVGHYTIKNGETELPAGTTFYVYRNNMYFGASVPAGAAEGAQRMINQFLDRNSILYVANGDEYVRLNSTRAAAAGIVANFAIAHPAKEIRKEAILPHRYVTLQLTTIPTGTKLYYSPNGTDEYMAVEDLESINTLLWNQIGVAEAYEQGCGYFSMPIRHLGFTENGEPLTETGELDWAKVSVGDFGLVRNHIYTLGVSSIEGRATGIENLNNPIVPPADIDSYFINYRLNILNWRIVPAQTGIILK